MSSKKTFWLNQINISSILLLIVTVVGHSQDVLANPAYTMSQFASSPINIAEEAVRPQVMINASNDHQLFFKAYNDYSDLDKDGVVDTTYKHSIDYYGYFDSYKCYEYQDDSTLGKRFVPKTVNTDKYCTPNSGQWSGNFLNWASMARIDSIRKILFGGHRRVDTATTTILERSYLPHDAHSWAKYYSGADIERLTPFVSKNRYPAATTLSYNCDAQDLTFNTDGEPTDGPATCKSGGVLDRKLIGITIGNTTDHNPNVNGYSHVREEPPLIKVAKGNYSLWGSNERWQITWASDSPLGDNHSGGNGNSDPLISKIYAYTSSPGYNGNAIGNKEYLGRVQACVASFDSNGKSLLGQEKCKMYPGPDGKFGTIGKGADGLSGTADDVPDADYADNIYKPIGLLQVYGDTKEMDFGMIAGTYQNHASGGDLIKNIKDMYDEINVDTDGTFPKVHEFAGGPANSTNNKSGGLINAWSLYRIVGYNINDGHYNDGSAGGDNCNWGLSAEATVTAANRCQNWGNPFSEIYLASVNYFAGGGNIGQYETTGTPGIPGLPGPQVAVDSLDDNNSCARLSIVNFNSSVASYDYNELDTNSYGPTKIWANADLPSEKSTKAMTDFVGASEGLHGRDYYIGEKSLTEGVNTDDQLCVSKTVTSFGDAGGLCPEGPRLKGSFRIAGLAYYAHVKDIRPETDVSRKLDGPQVVDTYSVAMATALPVLSIPDPENTTNNLVKVIPACRNTGLDPDGNCAIVDFKIVENKIDSAAKTVTGTLYVDWEDSEQGGDYDQDMWGTLKYTLDKNAKTLTITTQVHAQSTGDAMAFGYVLGGTDEDGFHAHSGINGYSNTEIATGNSCSDSNGCNCTITPGAHQACDSPEAGVSTRVYDLGTSTAELFKDPLWYASKWGGFVDANDNDMPDQLSEWDALNNDTGLSGEDGIPDTYFYANNPRELEAALDRVFKAILERKSSGTAAAVVSSNVSGEGAMFQAYYEPLKKSADKEARWIGTVQALWLDNAGLTREDCSPPTNSSDYNPDTATACPSTPLPCGAPNGQLDDYCVDKVVETYFDELQGRTRVRVFESNTPDKFEAFSMQGVVKTITLGAVNSGAATVVMEPNSIQGNASYNTTSHELTITPYYMKGKVTDYDATTGLVTISVDGADIFGPEETFDNWQVSTSSGAGTGYSITALKMDAGTKQFTISPAGPWITKEDLTTDPTNPVAGDILTLKTKALVGASGEAFNNWNVECLNATAVGEVLGAGLKLDNSSTDTVKVQNDVPLGGFTSCSRAKLSTYDMRGTAGTSYSDWQVSNLQTLLGKGTSSTTLSLANSGNMTFTVSPNSNWLEEGHGILLANYSSNASELDEINYLWNGREKLSNLSESSVATNRSFSSNAASSGRFIMTWIDSNLNGIVDTGEYVPFVDSLVNSINYNFFDVESQAVAKDVINFVRGVEISGSRNRTVKYSTSSAEQVMRLGDIINSTPTVVGSPQEGFDLLYDDATFSTFRQKYQNRRIMVYVGGNDGLLHAFNSGFYNVITANGNKTVEYSVNGKKIDGNAATAHALGSEIWAYAPKNLLSHLKWLKDTTYNNSHVYFMDGKPRIFDANIFLNDVNHPGGWGTVMVVGMNLGGGEMLVDADSDQDGTIENGETHSLRSAFVVFDITNPEEEPKLLGELPMYDKSFTTVYPSVVSFRDTINNNCNNFACNKWYLQFGTGPNNITEYTSNQKAQMYLFDLSQLTTSNIGLPIASETVPTGPTGCSVTTMPPTVSPKAYHLIKCDTGIEKSFMGAPSVVDWNLNYYSDTSYFGLVEDSYSNSNPDTSTAGRVMRFDFNDSVTPANWTVLTTFFNPGRPVTAQLNAGFDDLNNRWLYFGTGRYFSAQDKLSTAKQYLFGIKDGDYGEDGDTNTNYPITIGGLMNVSSVEVYSDGAMNTTITSQEKDVNGVNLTFNTFEGLEEEIDTYYDGWYLELPPIIGDSSYPATRNVTRSALAGGVLFSSVFQPSDDPCEGEGRSRLYGLYYKTGTAYPDPSVFGSTIEVNGTTVRYRSNKFIELGRGFATSPALTSGSELGPDKVRVSTQLSTGDIVESTAETILNVRTGKTSWSDR